MLIKNGYLIYFCDIIYFSICLCRSQGDRHFLRCTIPETSSSLIFAQTRIVIQLNINKQGETRIIIKNTR